MFALLPAFAWAQDAIGENGAVCKFFSNINNILNIASIAVVTIAVIFAGYQIAFAHKRISDVAPVLIGGLLIGGAAQFAKMLMPNQSDQCLGDMAMLLQALQPRSEEHTSELQSLMRISYAVFCLKKKQTTTQIRE